MAKEQAKLVTGLFKNRAAAETAVDAVLKRGYAGMPCPLLPRDEQTLDVLTARDLRI